MRAFEPTDFLNLWERGQPLHPLERSLLAIQAAFPDEAGEHAADWPLGERNRALARLRCAHFGDAIAGWTTCRACDRQMAFRIDGRRLIDEQAPVTHRIEIDGHVFRLPTSRDLASLAGPDLALDTADADAFADADPPDARTLATRLLARCCLDAERDTVWSADQVETIGECMAQADPLAEITIDLTCPACGEAAREALDLGVYFWIELEERARTLLHDVHALALAYGWTEPQTLALSPARRAFYIDMVQP
jgi:hypothetical protein